MLKVIPVSLSDEYLVENIAENCAEIEKYLHQKFRLQNTVESLILTDFLLDEYIPIIESNPLLQEQIKRQINYIRDRLATTKLAQNNSPDEVN